MIEHLANTKFVREVSALVRLLQTSRHGSIGELVGETGTGKTFTTRRYAIVTGTGSFRVCAYEGITRAALLAEVSEEVFGERYKANRLFNALREYAEKFEDRRPLLIVDEANKLNWKGLEALRFLADECGFAVLLVGTELYERQFGSVRTRPLLLQLGRRIGAKRVRMGSLTTGETYLHILKPVFGEVEKAVAKNFWLNCRKGNWGEALELVEECKRICDANGLNELTPAVLEAALSWTANRRNN